MGELTFAPLGDTGRLNDAWIQANRNGVTDYQKLFSYLVSLDAPREALLAATHPSVMPAHTKPVRGPDDAMRQEAMPAGGGAYIPGPVVSVPKRPLGTADRAIPMQEPKPTTTFLARGRNLPPSPNYYRSTT
jgi:hypothetical protein